MHLNPNNPSIPAIPKLTNLTNLTNLTKKNRVCSICNKDFKSTTRYRYCSISCLKEGRRQQSKRIMRIRRASGKVGKKTTFFIKKIGIRCRHGNINCMLCNSLLFKEAPVVILESENANILIAQSAKEPMNQ